MFCAPMAGALLCAASAIICLVLSRTRSVIARVILSRTRSVIARVILSRTRSVRVEGRAHETFR